MSARPAPLSTTDVYLGLVLDELQGLRADLAGRGGTPPPAAKPAPKKAAPAKGKRPAELDGR